jgi:hypothetical protein
MKTGAILRLKKSDIVLAGVLLAASLFSLLGTGNSSAGFGKNALVYKNGVLLKTLDMNRDSEFRAGEMLIEIRQGKLRIAESNCPRKICCHEGSISEAGQVITCVPNKVFIDIAGSGGASQFDATTN